MSRYPGIRASDEDRGRAAAALGEHYAAGRLSLEEFQERLDRVYAATTLGELGLLMADLPSTDLSRLPERRAPGPVQVPAGGSVLAWRAAWRFWLVISVVAFVIGLLGGASGGPWFLWAAVPLGLPMLRRWIARARPRPPGVRRRQPGQLLVVTGADTTRLDDASRNATPNCRYGLTPAGALCRSSTVLMKWA